MFIIRTGSVNPGPLDARLTPAQLAANLPVIQRAQLDLTHGASAPAHWGGSNAGLTLLDGMHLTRDTKGTGKVGTACGQQIVNVIPH